MESEIHSRIYMVMTTTICHIPNDIMNTEVVEMMIVVIHMTNLNTNDLLEVTEVEWQGGDD